MSFPIFFPALGGMDASIESNSEATPLIDHKQRSRTRGFITNKRLMLSLAEAGGRMMYSYKDLAALAGYTARVYALLSTLHRVHANAYYRKDAELYSLGDVQGTVQEGYDGIRMEHVPIVAPAKRGYSGEELIESLDLKIRAGQHVLISGGNGVGKTAVARVIAGLWPVYRGLVSKPKQDKLFHIPQRPYLSMGTLRDQLIYPDSHADMVLSGRRDRELLQILEIFKLEFVVHREGGWETKKDWKNVFSGGEKQRINLVRMFYHQPKYAILDEATSAISSDVEGTIYQEAKNLGITLITISHRPGLLKYHTHTLKIDGHEGWSFEPIGVEKERMSVENEIKDIEKQLLNVAKLKARRSEVERQLTSQVADDPKLEIAEEVRV